MNENMKISVVMPTYNCGKYIKEAIDSILVQTETADEIIIIDDGSVDNTQSIVNEYSNEKIKYYYQENSGVSAARNFGISIAQGKYIAFLDADDRWRATMLEEQLKVFLAEPDLVFCFTNFIRFEQESGQFLVDQFQFYPEIKEIKARPLINNVLLIAEDPFCELVGFGEVPAFTSCIMFNRLKIKGIEFNKKLRICEDAEFVLRASTQGKVAFNESILLDMRRHGANATNDVSNISFDKLMAFISVFEYKILNSNQEAKLRDRLVRSCFDAMYTSIKSRNFRKAFSFYWKSFSFPGSGYRKIKGTLRFMILIFKCLVFR